MYFKDIWPSNEEIAEVSYVVFGESILVLSFIIWPQRECLAVGCSI